jgi:hypothetical protein
LRRALAKSLVERYRTCGGFAAALAAAVGAHPAGVVFGPATPASPTRPVDTPPPAQVPRQPSTAAVMPAAAAQLPQPAVQPVTYQQRAPVQPVVPVQRGGYAAPPAVTAMPPQVSRLPNAGVYVPPWMPGVRSPAGGKAPGLLPAAYRFGWLSLPILAAVTGFAFAAPIESLYAMVLGFVVTVAVSRIMLGVRWASQHGSKGVAGVAARWAFRDLLGAIGLALLGYLAIGIGVVVTIPKAKQFPLNIDWLTLQVSKAPTSGGFTHYRQVGPFLHELGTVPVLVIALIVVLRWRADLRRPLALPRLASLLNRQPLQIRAAVAVALCLIAALVIGLNGGLSFQRRPHVCGIAPVSCAVLHSLPSGLQPGPHSLASSVRAVAATSSASGRLPTLKVTRSIDPVNANGPS